MCTVFVPIVNLLGLTPRKDFWLMPVHRFSCHLQPTTHLLHRLPRSMWEPALELAGTHYHSAIKGHGKVLKPHCRSKSHFQISLYGWECFKTEICFLWAGTPIRCNFFPDILTNCFMSVFSIRTVHGGRERKLHF